MSEDRQERFAAYVEAKTSSMQCHARASTTCAISTLASASGQSGSTRWPASRQSGVRWLQQVLSLPSSISGPNAGGRGSSSPHCAAAVTHRPTNRRFTPTASAASIRVLPALTIATAMRRNSACVRKIRSQSSGRRQAPAVCRDVLDKVAVGRRQRCHRPDLQGTRFQAWIWVGRVGLADRIQRIDCNVTQGDGVGVFALSVGFEVHSNAGRMSMPKLVAHMRLIAGALALVFMVSDRRRFLPSSRARSIRPPMQ